MTDILFAPHMTPFSVALGLLFGLMALELVTGLLGGTILGLGGDADLDMDVDLDADFDIDADLDADFDAELDGPDAAATDAAGGLTSWLGMGKVPLLIWVAAFLLAYGLGGFAVQNAMVTLLGWALPASIAGVALLPVGFGFARQFGGLFARLLPKTETTALSENHLGRTRGVVTVGTATRGRPAQVRITDRHGNMHYVQAEPVKDGTEIGQGTEVLVMRKGRQDGYRIVAISD